MKHKVALNLNRCLGGDWFRRFFSIAVFLPLALSQTPPDSTASGTLRDSLSVQASRNAAVAARGKKAWYAPRWDLSDLPHYVPGGKVSGKLRIWGNNYIADGKLADYWKDGFRKFHPDVEFEYYLPSSAVGLASLTCGVSDLGMSRNATFLELLGFQRLYQHDPIEIAAVTGAFDVPGWSCAYAIFVNKANPLENLSMAQLDGIFGSQRAGGWVGTEWHPEFARGADKNIRTWGQLGLKGEWADKPIHVYAVSMRYNSTTIFSDLVLKSSDQYNENIICHANYANPDGSLNVWFDQMKEELDHDLYGINFSFYNALTPKTKVVAIQGEHGGAYVPINIDTIHDLSYPLACHQFFYANRDPAKPLDPKVKEFLRYVLSQEGQTEVQRDGKYLPLTLPLINEQLKKLN